MVWSSGCRPVVLGFTVRARFRPSAVRNEPGGSARRRAMFAARGEYRRFIVTVVDQEFLEERLVQQASAVERSCVLGSAAWPGRSS